MTAGILTTNNDPTRRLSSKHVDLLRNQCDDVRTYMECGWFCVVGYKGDKRLVHAPCNNREEYETSMGLLRQSNPWNGYGEDGETGYLTKAPLHTQSMANRLPKKQCSSAARTHIPRETRWWSRQKERSARHRMARFARLPSVASTGISFPASNR